MTLAAVFCDFDGTISRRDVGYNLFHHFSGGKNDALLPDWKAGRLSTRDCLRQEAAMVRASEEEVYAFLKQFELNRGFDEFVTLCRAQDIDLQVISDGLDFYINHLLKRFGLQQLSVTANRGRLTDGGLVIEFPHDNRHCRRCGSCKGERIDEYRRNLSPDKVVAFVGDGYSDVCAVTEADIVFAKKDLEEYCRISNIAFHQYDDFYDVARKLVGLGFMKSESTNTLDGVRE
ncbi:MAG: MtnX-like HAD-IB family phosphatase [bacterium]